MADQVTIRMQVAVGLAAMLMTVALFAPENDGAGAARETSAAAARCAAITPVDPPAGFDPDQGGLRGPTDEGCGRA